MYDHRLGIALATASALAIAACGGSGLKPLGSGTGHPDQLAFAHCMRADGVPDWPDPTPPNGGPSGPYNSIFGFALPASINPEAPATRTALRECQHLITGNRPRPQRSLANYDAELKFARCMRANGVPAYPDPPPPHNGPQISAPPNVNQDAPAVQHASKVCGSQP